MDIVVDAVGDLGSACVIGLGIAFVVKGRDIAFGIVAPDIAAFAFVVVAVPDTEEFDFGVTE